jgi:hypothetical protein
VAEDDLDRFDPVSASILVVGILAAIFVAVFGG